MEGTLKQQRGSSILRVVSIIMIVYSVFSLIAGALMMMGVYLVAVDDEIGIAAGVAAVIGIIAFVGGLLDLFVGIAGFNASKHAGKNTLAFILGICSVVFGLWSLVSAIGTGDAGSIASSVVGLILPALYLYGVIQTRQGMA